jgi:hypothetical protein
MRIFRFDREPGRLDASIRLPVAVTVEQPTWMTETPFFP